MRSEITLYFLEVAIAFAAGALLTSILLPSMDAAMTNAPTASALCVEAPCGEDSSSYADSESAIVSPSSSGSAVVGKLDGSTER